MHTPVSTSVGVLFLIIRLSGAYTLFMHHCANFTICKLPCALSEFLKVSYLMLLSVTDFLYTALLSLKDLVCIAHYTVYSGTSGIENGGW
jgi:hypothetical protein